MKLSSLLVSLLVISITSFTANAEDKEVTYSTEEYCILKKANERASYLKAYAKKLGNTPNNSLCKSFNDFVSNAQPKEWDYKGGKPYPGSIIRLSPAQIKKLKAANK